MKYLDVFILYFSIINLIGLVICYIDKRKSIKGSFRIDENTLLFISFIGGCFGFYIGMKCFHHKTKKNKFRIMIPIMMVMWLFIIVKVVM